MKKEYKLTTLAFIFGISLSTAGNAYAILNLKTIRQTQTLQVTATPTSTPSATITIKKIDRVVSKLTLKKTNAIKEINRRLAGLSKLEEKLSRIKKITQVQKETLIAEIKIEVSNLEELRAKIEAETDTTTLQELKKSIMESHRIYGLFIPKIEIIAHADKIIEIANAMAERTSDESLLGKISESKAKAQSAIDLVLPLTPEDFPGYKTTLKTARDLLRDARTSLNDVFPELKRKNQ